MAEFLNEACRSSLRLGMMAWGLCDVSLLGGYCLSPSRLCALSEETSPALSSTCAAVNHLPVVFSTFLLPLPYALSLHIMPFSSLHRCRSSAPVPEPRRHLRRSLSDWRLLPDTPEFWTWQTEAQLSLSGALQVTTSTAASAQSRSLDPKSRDAKPRLLLMGLRR